MEGRGHLGGNRLGLARPGTATRPTTQALAEGPGSVATQIHVAGGKPTHPVVGSPTHPATIPVRPARRSSTRIGTSVRPPPPHHPPPPHRATVPTLPQAVAVSTATASTGGGVGLLAGGTMHEPASQTRRTIRFNNQNGKNHTIRAVAAEPKGKASRRSAPEPERQRRQHRTARRSSNQQRDDPPQGGGKGGAASRRVPSLQRSRTSQPSQTVRQRPIEYSSGSEAPERLQRYGYGV